MTASNLPCYDSLAENEMTREEVILVLNDNGFLTEAVISCGAEHLHDAIKYRIFEENPVDCINDYCRASGKIFRDPWFQYLKYDEPYRWTKDFNGVDEHGVNPDDEKEDVHQLEWKRPAEINPDMVMYLDGVVVSDAYQGGIGNCGVCAMNTAIQCLEAEPIRTNLYPNEISEFGCYSWKTFRNGKFGFVLFDDLIACTEGSGCPWSWHSTDNLEGWPMFLEKSMAKSNGTYNPWPANGWNRNWEFPRPVMMDAGFVYRIEEKFRLQNDEDWPFMVENAGKGAIAAEQFRDVEGTGLIATHGYACLGAAVVGDKHLLKWRNPWGCAEWNGAWSDGSPLWDEYPEVKAACNDGSRRDTVDAKRGADDGAFWMEREDLYTHLYAHNVHMIVLAEEAAGYQNSAESGVIVTGPEGTRTVCARLTHSGGDLLWSAECYDTRWTKDNLHLYCELYHMFDGARQALPFYSTQGMNHDLGREPTDHRIHLLPTIAPDIGEIYPTVGGDILLVFGWEHVGGNTECTPPPGEGKAFYVRVSTCNKKHCLNEIEEYAPYEANVSDVVLVEAPPVAVSKPLAAKDFAEMAAECGGQAYDFAEMAAEMTLQETYDRVMACAEPDREMMYSRLKNGTWYADEARAADQRKQEAYQNGGQEVYDRVMACAEPDREMMYNSFGYPGFWMSEYQGPDCNHVWYREPDN